MIIFAENSRLSDSYPQLLNDTSKDLLVNVRLWFLNGKRVATPIEQADYQLEGPGILLVYDAHDNTTHREQPTVEMIAKLSAQYSDFYVCYHDVTERKWRKALKELKKLHGRKALSRKHTQEPYFSLHRFHLGELSLDDLTVHWDAAELGSVPRQREALVNMLDSLFEQKAPEGLSDAATAKLVRECLFKAKETEAYDQISSLLRTLPDARTWHDAIIAFRLLIVPPLTESPWKF